MTQMSAWLLKTICEPSGENDGSESWVPVEIVVGLPPVAGTVMMTDV